MARWLAAVVGMLLLAGCAPTIPDAPPGSAPVTRIDVRISEFSWPDQPRPPAREFELVQDAQRVVDLIGQQMAYDESQDCTSDGGPTAELTVHSGGQTIPVTMQVYGCGLTTGWGEDRGGAKTVYPLLLELLEEQRIATPDPAATPAACPDPLAARVDDVERTPYWAALDWEGPVQGPPYPAVGARVCSYPQTNAGPAVDRLVDDVAAERLRGLVRDGLVPGWSEYPCPSVSRSAYVLVFVDRAGGSFEVRLDPACGGVRSGDWANGHTGPELVAAVEAATS